RAQGRALVALARRVLHHDLEATELGELARDGMDLGRVDEHALDLLDRAHLSDERHARRRAAARARAGEEAIRVARRVADQREGAAPELGRDQLAHAARADRRAALRIEELAEEGARVKVHAVVRAALARDRTHARLAHGVAAHDAQ